MKKDDNNIIQKQPESIRESDELPGAEKPCEVSELPKINPLDEQVFSWREKLKMIIGGYTALLPAFIAILVTFIIVYLLVRAAS